MQVSLIVNIVGPDRPGLIEQLSSAVTASEGNWEDSRMIRLAGHFAGMVQVVILERDLPELEANLAKLEEDGLKVTTVNAGASDDSGETEGTPFILEVMGQDRTGIVSEISKTLAAAGANVVELATDCSAAPWSGERLFKTTATVIAPDHVAPEQLQEQIEAIANDLMVEIQTEV
ncbi:MAG: ACT domain-containing protein [Verrucomicrobiales bacterium]